MLNDPQTEKEDILERLRHPERRHESRKMSRNLFVRNILNGIFILLALVAIVGIVVAKENVMIWYAIGLVAVVIKMVEVILRMPNLRR